MVASGWARSTVGGPLCDLDGLEENGRRQIGSPFLACGWVLFYRGTRASQCANVSDPQVPSQAPPSSGLCAFPGQARRQAGWLAGLVGGEPVACISSDSVPRLRTDQDPLGLLPERCDNSSRLPPSLGFIPVLFRQNAYAPSYPQRGGAEPGA